MAASAAAPRRVAPTRSRLGSGLAGAAVALAVLAAGLIGSTPLPVLGWAAAFLFLAVENDLHAKRIPNALTFPTLAAGLAWAAWSGGVPAVAAAALGAGGGFALLVVPYAAGALGAGDVKAAMALGALLGPAPVARVLLIAIALGGALGLLHLAWRGELGALARRWGRSLLASLATRRLVYEPPAPGSAARQGIPFALALGLASAAGLLLEASA